MVLMTSHQFQVTVSERKHAQTALKYLKNVRPLWKPQNKFFFPQGSDDLYNGTNY